MVLIPVENPHPFFVFAPGPSGTRCRFLARTGLNESEDQNRPSDPVLAAAGEWDARPKDPERPNRGIDIGLCPLLKTQFSQYVRGRRSYQYRYLDGRLF